MRTLTTFAALAATAALAAPTALAAPVPSAAPLTSAALSAPAQAMPSAGQLTSLADALRRDLGLTPEQFLAQATVGDRLSRTQSAWQQQFADSFGGAWLTDRGIGTVGVAPGTQARALAATAKAAGFQIQDVALTSDQLTAQTKKVASLLASLPADQRNLIREVRPDQARSTVLVSARGGTSAQLGAVSARLGRLATVEHTADVAESVPASVPAATPVHPTKPGSAKLGTDPLAAASTLVSGTGFLDGGPVDTILRLLTAATTATGSVLEGMNSVAPSVPAAGQRPAAQPTGTGPVLGGTAYEVAIPGGALECSSGFSGELNGHPVVITAAHCSGPAGSRARLADGSAFGTFTSVKAANVDSALIAVDNAQAPRFANNLVGTGRTTQAITGTAAPVVGQKACKSGARTGFSCGTISQVGATIDVSGKRTITNGFTTDLCALPGDSGGVVFSGDKALGISSASNVADAPDCAAAAADAKTHGYTPRLSSVPMADILAAQPGLRLRTS